MCGICGFFNLDAAPIDGGLGSRMIEMLRHRGPDESGNMRVFSPDLSPGVSLFLGHARLRIIDLSEAAQQPLANEDKTVFVVFNGEIYNFRDLRQQLQAAGHRFRSQSDTEVIVHAYEQWGDEALDRLDGMFAFALWDARKVRLLLARDRTGKKPLYYHFDGKRFTFGSEIKALRVCPWVKDGVAIDRIPEYLSFGYVLTPRTLYQDIFQIPPGYALVLEKGGLKGPFPYWQFRFSAPEQERRMSVRQAAERVRDLLVSAVAKRLESDVPLGVLLSGGLDSSIVVGIMAQVLKRPVQTFSIGFGDDPSFDERRYAAAVAQQFSTEHREFVVRMDATALMERLLWHHDQPYGDSAALPTYLLCKMTRDFVTVALNGDGGDEVFGGYDRFRAALLASRVPTSLWKVGRSVSRFFPGQYGYYGLRRRMERFFGSVGNTAQEKYLSWMTIFGPDLLQEILRPEIRQQCDLDGIRSRLFRFFEDTADRPLLDQLLYVNFKTYLPDDLHVKMDRMSMANSLETRSPMLDTNLIEFVAGLPTEMKIHGGITKYILKYAFRDLLPPMIVKRKKHGFGVPLALWFRGGMGKVCDDLLLAEEARSLLYLEPGVVRRILREHLSGAADHGYRLWALLQFELWLRMREKGTAWKPSSSDLCAVKATTAKVAVTERG